MEIRGGILTGRRKNPPGSPPSKYVDKSRSALSAPIKLARRSDVVVVVVSSRTARGPYLVTGGPFGGKRRFDTFPRPPGNAISIMKFRVESAFRICEGRDYARVRERARYPFIRLLPM